MEHHYEHFWLDPKFWVAVSFVVFLALVGRRLWTALTDALDARAGRVRSELAEAARLRSEAEAMLKQAEADRAAALREAEAMVAGAKAEALNARLNAQIEDAERRIAESRDRAMTALRTVAADAAEALVARLTGGVDRAAVEEAVGVELAARGRA